ncbi:MAG TPA: CHAP domain-containing protein [Anaerolineaceae bacterium]|nr:CHAP domain-containing protein [Anaerolineaceae bacterium]HOU45260.1 CHAP domain-containing protein [Anaerolineaceae bacterium]HQF46843.1 CHAP domain-containing protein [Anaerolineaceae bacterium]HQH36736.1 CHAP domain-containing protein [Anaerolineaceae bacterium]HQP62385.1 CHAP domain-containing protein [Anaerolineaceae bacterium]
MADYIHIEPELLRELARQMQLIADISMDDLDRMKAMIYQMSWSGDDRDRFVASASHRIRQINENFNEIWGLGLLIQKKLALWEEVDSELGLPAWEVLTAAMGSVLGISTLGIVGWQQQYDSMRWDEKFQELDTIRLQILDQESHLGAGRTSEDIQAELDGLERQIAQLKAERDAVQQKADAWYNQVIPDFPLAGDKEDGVPWRVRADDFEDAVQDYDSRLASLEQQRLQVKSLLELKEREAYLTNRLFESGIPQSTTPNDTLSITGGCKHYVGTLRDITGMTGDAHAMNDSALAAGYEVGDLPVKGSIIVFEKGHSHSAGDVGHVGYVESVTPRLDGGYDVVYSHAATIYTPEGWIRGQHRLLSNTTITIPADGYPGTSFIYDKPPL